MAIITTVTIPNTCPSYQYHHTHTHTQPVPPAPTAKTHHLRLCTTLHQRRLSTVQLYSLEVVCQAGKQAGEAQCPEDDSEGHAHAALELRGLALEVEGDDDGDGDDAEVDG